MADEIDRLVVLLDLGRWKDAEGLAREVIRLYPDWSPGYVYLARSLLGQRQYLPAEQAARDGVKKDPHDPWAHVILGWAHFRRERFRDARHQAEEALRLRPDYVPAYQLLADVLNAWGRFTAARRAAVDGLRYDPSHEGLLAAKGWAEHKLGRAADAQETAERALEKHPTSDQIHNLLGCVLWTRAEKRENPFARLRLHRRAEQHLMEAIRLDPAAAAYQDNRRNNALSCRRGLLWILLPLAAGLSGLATVAGILGAGREAHHFVALFLFCFGIGGGLPLLLLWGRDQSFLLAAPLGRVGAPAVPLTPQQRSRGRAWWWLSVGCLVGTPLVAWVIALTAGL